MDKQRLRQGLLFSDCTTYLIKKWLFIGYLVLMVVTGVYAFADHFGLTVPPKEYFVYGLRTAFGLLMVLVFMPESKDSEFKFSDFFHKLTFNILK